LIQTFWENFSHKSTVDPTGLLGKMTLVMTLQKLSVSSRDIIVIYIYAIVIRKMSTSFTKSLSGSWDTHGIIPRCIKPSTSLAERAERLYYAYQPLLNQSIFRRAIFRLVQWGYHVDIMRIGFADIITWDRICTHQSFFRTKKEPSIWSSSSHISHWITVIR
jgi:hypothetical protein